MGMPDAARTIPAAVNSAPNTNKSRYIRPSPAPAKRPDTALMKYCDNASRTAQGFFSDQGGSGA
jgi:hypothetical protein